MDQKYFTDKPDAADFYRKRDQWIDWILERNDLHQTARLTGVWLARRLNSKTGDTWFQVSTIAARLNVSPRTIIRAIHDLETAGAIRVWRDGRRGVKRAVNRYEILSPMLLSDIGVTL